MEVQFAELSSWCQKACLAFGELMDEIVGSGMESDHEVAVIEAVFAEKIEGPVAVQ